MSSTEQPAEVAAYLRQLDVALADVPKSTASEIRLGIAEELASLPPDEARDRIIQLGDPTFIASEAREGAEPSQARSGLSSRVYIIVASLAVAVGGLIVPIVGWVVGYVLVWISPAWRRWEKVVAIVAPAGAGLLIAGYFTIAELQSRAAMVLHSDQPALPIASVVIWNATVVFALANLALGVWLMVRALRRK